MASIIQIPETGKYRAQVRRQGFKTVTCTFTTRKLASDWANKREAEIEESIAHGRPIRTDHTVAQAIARYRKVVGKKKPIGRTKDYALKQLSHPIDGLGAIKLCDLTAAHVVNYIVQKRDIAGVTATIEFGYLNSILLISRDLFQWPAPENTMPRAKTVLTHLDRLGTSDERDRRPSDDELAKLREWFGAHSNSLTPDILDFILDSCFRPPSEIIRLRWSDLNVEYRTIMIRDRKDPKKKLGNHQIVPLLGRCLEIIQRQPRTSEFIFPVNGKSWSSIFPRACKAMKIEDLRLYDLRHEAISRLVERTDWGVYKIMHVTGHKDPKTLKRYVQLRGKDHNDAW